MDYRIIHKIPITVEIRLELELMLEEILEFTHSFKEIQVTLEKYEKYKVTVCLVSIDQSKIEVSSESHLDFNEAMEMSKEQLLTKVLTEFVLSSA